MNSLQEFLDQQEQVNNESFEVTNEEQANWALRKIKQLQEEQKENNALAEAEISKIEEWLQSVNGNLQGSIDYFQSLLAQYAMNKRKTDPKFKSQKLPNGAIRFRKQQPKFKYDDEALVQSLKQVNREDLVRVKETPDKTGIKKAFVVNGDKLINPETGEVIKGVEVEHREDKFEVVTD